MALSRVFHRLYSSPLEQESTSLPITPIMGIQSRLSKPIGHGKDEESLPLNTNDDQFKDHAPRSFIHHLRNVGGSLALILACFCLWSTISPNSSTGLDFPWPKPDPVPVPSFIAEGIKQCGIISRPPPSHKPATSARKLSDRFVKGTRAVWLKNGTVWTGEKGGEEVLYGVDVLMDGGVVRQVGKAKDIGEMIKKGDIEEVELNGAWVTPGRSIFMLLLSTLSIYTLYPLCVLTERYYRHALSLWSGSCAISQGNRRYKLAQSCGPPLAPVS
jgi:hypothetical protein